MKCLYILRGLPAAGKSTFAHELASNEEVKRTNKDEIRDMLGYVHSYENAKFVYRVNNYIIKKALEEGNSVVSDNTNLREKNVTDLHKIASSVGDVTVIEKVFKTSLEECIERDSKRPKPVGREVIEGFANRYQISKMEDKETVYQSLSARSTQIIDTSLRWAVVVDLDGTAALCHPGRNIYDATTCDLDIPNGPVIATVKALWTTGDEVLFVSGRDEKFREPTEKFIEMHFTCPSDSYRTDRPDYCPIEHKLFMRPAGDTRSDSVIKREIYDNEIKGKYNVRCVIDDRPSVVRMWRYDLGITVFQLNDVEF